jgi:hypothetical protein
MLHPTTGKKMSYVDFRNFTIICKLYLIQRANGFNSFRSQTHDPESQNRLGWYTNLSAIILVLLPNRYYIG